MDNHPKKDFLSLNLRDLPYFRSLLRATESRFYLDLELPAPTLDVGCGDGHFASVTFDRPIEVGLDPWRAPLLEAKRYGGYRWLLQAEGGRIPFPEGYFASAFSNSVLEHIPDVQAVLHEVARVLQPGAPFYFCVPNPNFTRYLSLARAFERLRLPALAEAYRRLFNRISRHHHCDPPEVWQERLEQAGFELRRWFHYFSPQALAALEWGHYFGLPALVTKRLFGRWVVLRHPWNTSWIYPLLEGHVRQPLHEHGAYTFYITAKRT